MNKFILPHMYLFFGVICFILIETGSASGELYTLSLYISIAFMLIGLIWILILLFNKSKR
ncbi:MAG TPA: hypothetical protein DCO80_06160 [Ornithinibacillus sp.]|nr:hypothetical protein [Ornithinibacillus sp.]